MVLYIHLAELLGQASRQRQQQQQNNNSNNNDDDLFANFQGNETE
jgi:hypothetical protein